MMKRTFITLLLTFASIMAVNADSVLNLKKSLTDNNIVVPETYDVDLDKMMKGWWENGYIEMERQHSDGKPVEVSDEVLADRLSKMPTAIEMPYNQVVGQWIRMYLNRKSMVENMLGLSMYYMPIFERALESRGMPIELKYLPVIESAMNPVAVSPAGAAGLWQFMPSTGRGVGLELSSLVDERLDPIKSSEKAADYLKSLYNMYNDWSLAIAAYNCGPGNVNKALRRAGGRRGNDFWTIYRYLPKETRGYVPAFIAANYVMTYYNKHGISPALARRPLVTDTVHVNHRVHFQQIAEVLDIPVSEIKLLNPQYRRGEIPGDIRPYSLTLPSRQVLAYIMFEDSILNHRAEDFTRRRIVEPGESASARQDDGGEKDYVVETTTKQVTTYHTVHKRESLGSIARRYGVSSSDLARWNGLGHGKVKKGQRLKIIQTKKVTVRRAKPKANDTDGDDNDESESNYASAESHTTAKSGILGESVNGSVPPPPAKTKKESPSSIPVPNAASPRNNSGGSDVPMPHNSGKNANTKTKSQDTDNSDWAAKKSGQTLVIPSRGKSASASSSKSYSEERVSVSHHNRHHHSKADKKVRKGKKEKADKKDNKGKKEKNSKKSKNKNSKKSNDTKKDSKKDSKKESKKESKKDSKKDSGKKSKKSSSSDKSSKSKAKGKKK